MKKILFFSNISLVLVLSACGSSGTPQAQGEGTDTFEEITLNSDNTSEPIGGTITEYVSGPQSERQTEDLGFNTNW